MLYLARLAPMVHVISMPMLYLVSIKKCLFPQPLFLLPTTIPPLSNHYCSFHLPFILSTTIPPFLLLTTISTLLYKLAIFLYYISLINHQYSHTFNTTMINLRREIFRGDFDESSSDEDWRSNAMQLKASEFHKMEMQRVNWPTNVLVLQEVGDTSVVIESPEVRDKLMITSVRIPSIWTSFFVALSDELFLVPLYLECDPTIWQLLPLKEWCCRLHRVIRYTKDDHDN